MRSVDPYDELSYRSLPIEWTAPERLGLTSLLHGGPRVRLESYRVLELGCGDGANLLPMAYYRPEAHFVGVDAAASAIATGRARCAELGLANVEFVQADFTVASRSLSGHFNFIIAHGVFSWITNSVRDHLLSLCAHHLAYEGLLYLNYNSQPGWKLRGLVRRFLLTKTAHVAPLRDRAELARNLAVKVSTALAQAPEHPYARLLEREFRFAAEGDISYIAHEFLAADNHAYWRSEFLALVTAHNLSYVADADFNYASGRVSPDLRALIALELGEGDIEDTFDLLSYRQLHSPILTTAGWRGRPPDREDLGRLVVASRLKPAGTNPNGARIFHDPDGVVVEAKEEPIAAALTRLAPLWPRGIRMTGLLRDDDLTEDLTLLHRHGLVELRLVEPSSSAPPSEPLNAREATWTGYVTSPYHTIARVVCD
jgi:SAM-dependent methyltransferase